MTLSNVIRGKTTVTRRGPGKIILAARTFGRCFRRDLGNPGKQAERVSAPRVLLALLRADGQSKGVSMFQGHYLDTVLQNEVRRRDKRRLSRSFQAMEDAADEAAAEEEAKQRACPGCGRFSSAARVC